MCELELKRNRKRFDKAATQETRSPIDLRSNKSKALLVSSAQEIDYGTLQELKEKRAAVAQFEDKARVLVEAMRVKDLRFCPKRYCFSITMYCIVKIKTYFMFPC